MNYSIENLDVYRRSISTGASLCRSAAEAAGKGSPSLAEQLQKRALSLVTNLADGLGFWEKEIKAAHFADSKRAVLESLTLLEVMTSLKLMTTEEQKLLADELRDLARMISGLLRGAKRKEKKPAAEGEEAAVVVREGGIVYH